MGTKRAKKKQWKQTLSEISRMCFSGTRTSKMACSATGIPAHLWWTLFVIRIWSSTLWLRKQSFFRMPKCTWQFFGQTALSKVKHWVEKSLDSITQSGHRILVTVLQEKSRQNSALKDQLLQTKSAILAKASPKDAIFGICLDRKQALQTDSSQWPG